MGKNKQTKLAMISPLFKFAIMAHVYVDRPGGKIVKASHSGYLMPNKQINLNFLHVCNFNSN